MTDEARAARNAYKRQWNAANKDKVKAQQARHWEKRAAQIKAAESNAADDAYYNPEFVTREFDRIFLEKRAAGEILNEKPTPEQAEQILMQIFTRGVTRPEVIDD